VILKAALREAVAQGLLAVNPADKARPPAAREARPPEIHPWSAEELAAFLAWAREGERPDAAAWHVLAYTGMRRGEALALRWRDIDFEQRRLSVRRSVGLVRTKGEGAEIIEGPTKSGKNRVVDLDAGTIEVLRRHRRARAGLDLRLARDESLVFGDSEGQPQHPERFSRRFSEQLARFRRQLGDAAPR
jgi:integrase